MCIMFVAKEELGTQRNLSSSATLSTTGLIWDGLEVKSFIHCERLLTNYQV